MPSIVSKVRATLNREPIALVVSFVLGIALGLCVGSSLFQANLTAFLPAAATLVAAFMGATFAFLLNKHKDAEARHRQNLNAGNRAIFSFARQVNKLMLIKRQIIEPSLNDPLRLVSMRPMDGLDAENVQLDIDSLDFLIEAGYASLLGDIAFAQTKYMSAIDAMKSRSRVHIHEAQPRLENAPIIPGPVTVDSMKIVLGSRVFETLRLATDQAIVAVDSAIEELPRVSSALNEALKRTFPGKKIIKFDVPSAT